MQLYHLVSAELFLLFAALSVGLGSGFKYNGTCTDTVECIPRETFMRCTKGHCLCAADSNFDFRMGLCRLKIHVRCVLTTKHKQPCVKDAYCDPPSYADGQKIHGAQTGNCVCFRGESIEEDGTCSAAPSFQRSFGHRSAFITSPFKAMILLIAVCATGIGWCAVG